jgi:hypothetical protein
MPVATPFDRRNTGDPGEVIRTLAPPRRAPGSGADPIAGVAGQGRNVGLFIGGVVHRRPSSSLARR